MNNNCKNCGARYHAIECDYCGTAQSMNPKGQLFMYDSTVVTPDRAIELRWQLSQPAQCVSVTERELTSLRNGYSPQSKSHLFFRMLGKLF